MTLIKNEIEIDAPLERVYALAKDVESFPAFMPDVESVAVTERSPDSSRTITEWVGVASDFKIKIRWTEEDLWDDAQRTCRFRQLRGDYQQYEGEWRFASLSEDRTRFESEINYAIEIPLIGLLLKALVAKLMRENTQRLLTAIKTRAETG